MPAALLFLGLGILAFGLVPQLTAPLAYGLVLGAYLLDFVGPLLDLLGTLLDASPFRHLAEVPVADLGITAAALMLGIGVVFAVVGVAVFEVQARGAGLEACLPCPIKAGPAVLRFCAGRRAIRMKCTTCGLQTAPVWAHYTGHAVVDGLDGHSQFRLPMHHCAQGHIGAWREEEDCFVDLARAVDPADFEPLAAGTVAAQRRVLGGARCGQCGDRLRLDPTGKRLRGAVRLPIDGQHDSAEFDVDLPAVACRSCTARPAGLPQLMAGSGGTSG